MKRDTGRDSNYQEAEETKLSPEDFYGLYQINHWERRGGGWSKKSWTIEEGDFSGEFIRISENSIERLRLTDVYDINSKLRQVYTNITSDESLQGRTLRRTVSVPGHPLLKDYIYKIQLDSKGEIGITERHPSLPESRKAVYFFTADKVKDRNEED